jgi:glycosyltransferase involved in cell wall biosynthesis
MLQSRIWLATGSDSIRLFAGSPTGGEVGCGPNFVSPSMTNRNLLLVTYSVPPFGGVGVHRALSLAKYLPALGWTIDVLTARNPSAVGSDTQLLRQIPDSVTVHRTMTIDLPFQFKTALTTKLGGGGQGGGQAVNETPGQPPTGRSGSSRLIQPFKDFLSPDPQVLWLPFAIREARRIVTSRNIDTVLVTVPPYSSLQIGIALKKKFPRLTLVSDFRDEWLTYYFHTLGYNRSEHALARAVQIERECVERSDVVVTVTERARLEMRRRYPDQPEEKFRLNGNGYDPEAFREFSAKPNLTEEVLLGYTGTVYAPADPARFVEALRTLPDHVRARLRIRFIGHVENPAFRALLESQPEMVRLDGFLPQARAVAALESMDFVLLIWNDEINIPGKLYDYLGTGKPIVAIAHPDGEVWRILAGTRAGWCADCRDPGQIAGLLVNLCERKDEFLSAYRPDRDAIRRCERTQRAVEYSALLDAAAVIGN